MFYQSSSSVRVSATTPWRRGDGVDIADMNNYNDDNNNNENDDDDDDDDDDNNKDDNDNGKVNCNTNLMAGDVKTIASVVGTWLWKTREKKEESGEKQNKKNYDILRFEAFDGVSMACWHGLKTTITGKRHLFVCFPSWRCFFCRNTGNRNR